MEEMKNEKLERITERIQEGVELAGYTTIVLVFLVLCLMAFVAPAIDAKTEGRVNEAKADIKYNVAAMANVDIKDLHFRREGGQYYVSSGDTEIIVTDQKVQKIIDGAGITSDDMIGFPRDVVVYSISIGVSLVFLAIAIALRHRNNRRLLIWTSAVEMATLMTMTDTRRVLHGASPTDDFFNPKS